jgi:superfamily II DNA or RNA helicase
LLKTSAQYTIGLSATPERSDGMTKVINWHVGNILYEMEKKYNYRVLVKKIFFRSSDILFREKVQWFQRRFAPSHTKMTENLTNIKTRNQLIVNFIDVLKGMGRKILILSYRVEHLELLKGMVDAKIKADGESHIYNSYYYMGKTKRAEKDMAEKDGHVIFATMQFAEEGLDIAHLDTVLFALPVSIQKDKKKRGKIKSAKALIQSIGRILRNDKLEDFAQIPLVVDISDMFSIYSGWSNKRNEIYEKKNWYMQNYYWEDLEYQFKSSQDKKANPMNVVFDDITDEDFIEKNLMLTEEEAAKIALEDKLDEDKTDETNTDTDTTDEYIVNENENENENEENTTKSNGLDNPEKNNKTNTKSSGKKSLKQKNDLENVVEPVVTYGFGRTRY